MLFPAVIFLGSFLLFQVQPVLAKVLLPWFGGTAAVWTMCLLFFQVMLVVGYAYANVARPRAHAIILIASLAWMPLWPSAPAGTGAGGDVFLILLYTVGPAYVLLAATSPLLQRWYRGGNPYRLYALSNLASLLALLSYPILVEPWISSRWQMNLWSAAYALFVLGCAAAAWRSVPAGPPEAGSPPLPIRPLWILLAACGSGLLMATTNQMCQEVASIPFLWVAPLALYLASFIIVFDRPHWYRRVVFSLLAAILTPISCVLFVAGGYFPVAVTLFVVACTLFVCLMMLHGELALSKPDAPALGRFYFAIALGGALGGAFVAVLAPSIFRTYAEFPLLLASCGLLAVYQRYRSGEFQNRRRLTLPARASLAGLAITILVPLNLLNKGPRKVIEKRNFYGILRVSEHADAAGTIRTLTHGVTIHGMQFTEEPKKRIATAYYGIGSGVGLAMQSGRLLRRGPLHVGIIGLGTGTMARYGRQGDRYRFYEINPDVTGLANQYFTFLKDSPAQITVVEGDARIRLRDEPPQAFDVLVVDAFSSDSIPAHLLTAECGVVYRRHLKPDGLLLMHISNRTLNLEPVVRGLARQMGYRAMLLDSPSDPTHSVFRSTWMELSPEQQPSGGTKAVLWTDDFASLWSILR
ncbi:MAG TPA: fused MFS/spermidine synthase [Bryobacteraceae bacterium]|nr:fused MFS/spermidine synthase [Bryobacteraceae bacterium]